MKNKILYLVLIILILFGVLAIAFFSHSQKNLGNANFVLDIGINSCNRNYFGPLNITVSIDKKLF